MRSRQTGFRTSDMMVCVMSRLLQDNEVAFHGVASHMPMIAILLAKATHAKNLVHLNIPGGVDPKMKNLHSYSTAGPDLMEQVSSEFPLQEVFDLSMRGGLDVAFLSGIQFDGSGNVNASVIGDYHRPKVRMPGGAGSAVLIPTAKKAIIWRTKHDVRTFVPKVDFVTTKGNIYRIVTPLCTFRQEGDKILLDSLHPGVTLEEVAENTGFPLEYTNITQNESPTPEELAALNRIDPKDLRNIEFC